jgi:hypothetical protein
VLSSVVKVGDMLYLSGRSASCPAAGLAEGGIGPETHQALENIKRVLRPGSSDGAGGEIFLSHLADVADFRAMNESAGRSGRRPAGADHGGGGGVVMPGSRSGVHCPRRDRNMATDFTGHSSSIISSAANKRLLKTPQRGAFEGQSTSS